MRPIGFFNAAVICAGAWLHLQSLAQTSPVTSTPPAPSLTPSVVVVAPPASTPATPSTSVTAPPTLTPAIPVTPSAPVPPAVTGPAPTTAGNDAAWRLSAPFDVSSPRSPSPSARLANASVRANTGSGTSPIIAGAVVQGAGPLPLLVRAIGPGLATLGVPNWLRRPTLEIYRDGVLAAQTNTLETAVAAASAYVGAFPPLGSSDGSAAGDVGLVGQATAGAITAHCRSAQDASGVALLEFYDATAAPSATSARVVNFSARARVEAGAGLVVVGFVVAGEGDIRLLLRAVGPSLAQLGLTDVLADPVIELYAGSAPIAANDNWQGGDPGAAVQVESAGQAAGAFGLTSSKDAAMLVTLQAGAYTLQVRGAGGQTGVALAEIYEVAAAEFDAAMSTNAVGLDLYRQLAAGKPGQSVIISPYSIESALGLAYAGAAGETRSEMARVLRFPSDNALLQAGFAGLRNALALTAEQAKQTADARTRSGRRTDPIEWQAANRLFGQQGYAFRDSFLTLMADGFAAPFQALDFRTNTERSRVTINTWVEDQTRQKIKDLIPSGGLTEFTRLVLVNALYLKAPWDTPFEKFNTLPRAFHPTPGSSRDVPTMQRTASLGHATEDGLTIVTLDYLGGGLQFVIVLPDEDQTVETAAAKLTPEHLARWVKLGDKGRKNVALYLPKFKVEGATVPLGAALRTLGVKSAFDVPPGSANFDGIAPRRPDDYLAISDVFHQTFVALDEDGTEAAAATAVVIGTTSAPISPVLPIEVHVDRPFLFAIQHRASGACLFFGRVTDPR